MRVEFSRRIDGQYNIWRLEPRFSPQVMWQSRQLGWKNNSLYYWNLISVQSNQSDAAQYCKQLKAQANAG